MLFNRSAIKKINVNACLLLVGVIFNSSLLAVDFSCNGKVVFVMDYPNNCDGNTAFKTSGSKGKWICPASEKGNALVLAAVMSARTVSVYFDSQNGALTCETMPNYIKARYVIVGTS